MIDIRQAINEVMRKLTLLEGHQHRLKEEEFTKTWISFSRPLDIIKARQECHKRMKSEEKTFYEELGESKKQLVKEAVLVKDAFNILQRVNSLDEY